MSQNDNGAGGIMLFAWIGTIVAFFVCGAMAWDWVQPESFGKVLVFLVVWTVLTWIAHFVIMLLAAVLLQNNDR